jgi:hypothetical protein
MLNAIILLVGGITLGVLLASTLGSGVYQSVTAAADRTMIVQTNTQTGAIRLCAPESYSYEDPLRGDGIRQLYVDCTDWFEKA